MAYTTIDLKDLKNLKREALDRDMTLKELVNCAVGFYLKHSKEEGGAKIRGPRLGGRRAAVSRKIR